MPGVFHTAYSGHTLGGNVKYQLCLTQHTQVLKKYWGIAISSERMQNESLVGMQHDHSNIK